MRSNKKTKKSVKQNKDGNNIALVRETILSNGIKLFGLPKGRKDISIRNVGACAERFEILEKKVSVTNGCFNVCVSCSGDAMRKDNA